MGIFKRTRNRRSQRKTTPQLLAANITEQRRHNQQRQENTRQLTQLHAKLTQQAPARP